MLDSLNIIIDETLEIYSLATLGGKLFIPFFICLVYILFSPAKEDDRARKYLVYPSLLLMFFIFNPVFIHFLYKYIEVPERIVRIYWPLPMDTIFIYCLIRFLGYLDKVWKKAVLLFMAVMLIYVNTGGIGTSQSYGPAYNPQKMLKGTKEISDVIYTLNNGEDPYIMLPFELFFWIRQYNPTIRIPYARDMDDMKTEDGDMDLDIVGQTALEGGCGFVVMSSSTPCVGDLSEYGFILASTIEAQDCQYLIYQLK